MSRDLLYEKLIRPVLFTGEPESVHYLAQHAMKAMGPLLPILPFVYRKDDLRVELFGHRFSNPIGLAAGFDKNAELLPFLPGLGFGFAELGSVCARPHGGNPQPRLFRLPEDKALINRLGLNGLGAEVVACRLEKQTTGNFPLGLNIAKTNDPSLKGEAAVKDIVYTFQRMMDLKQISYVTVNTSCPNTHEGCLKESEQVALVLDQICNDAKSRNLPILIKLSPDSEDSFIEDLVRLAKSYKIAGYVCGNTSISRASLKTPAADLEKIGNGGLSGQPLKLLNLELTRRVAAIKDPAQIIIGVGGVMTGSDAFDYLWAGATLLQLYTGFVYRGPATVKMICEELSAILKEKSIPSLNHLPQRPLSTQGS
ncbi:MAG: quinone-dependent dihydroorotate dehydrogenase [Candidatus Obscuribacterales bacterium]|nr:quinone-dependent dihydroorotate dehydrogenase [Candidatus Obscuribacterales bacterium]